MFTKIPDTDYCGCPICGFDCWHPTKPEIIGNIEDSHYEIVIPFWCEDGCNGKISFLFHKGNTSVEYYAI